ncbi:MAG: hypothetical protein WA634_19055 [Silvibacterium sp.]
MRDQLFAHQTQQIIPTTGRAGTASTGMAPKARKICLGSLP